MTEEKDIFRTLTPEEYEKVMVPSREEIREALRKTREDLRYAMTHRRTLPGRYV